MDITGKFLLDQCNGCADHCIRIFPADKKKVFTALCQIYPFPFVNLVGIYNNIALGRLTENVSQFYYIKTAGLDNVAKHISRAYTWKLVHIAYQYQTCSYVYCA